MEKTMRVRTTTESASSIGVMVASLPDGACILLGPGLTVDLDAFETAKLYSDLGNHIRACHEAKTRARCKGAQS
jgi:hypothetical protein